MLRATQLRVIKTAGANEYISSDIARVSTPLSILWLGEWVNRVIGMPISLLLTLLVPLDGVLKDI